MSVEHAIDDSGMNLLTTNHNNSGESSPMRQKRLTQISQIQEITDEDNDEEE